MELVVDSPESDRRMQVGLEEIRSNGLKAFKFVIYQILHPYGTASCFWDWRMNARVYKRSDQKLERWNATHTEKFETLEMMAVHE